MGYLMLVLSPTRHSPKAVDLAVSMVQSSKRPLLAVFVIDTKVADAISGRIVDIGFLGDKVSDQLEAAILKEYEARGRRELEEVRDKYGDERRTEIVAETEEIGVEDLIAEEDMVVTISHSGYIKRNAASLYRAQHRGGKGKTGMSTKEEDFVEDLFVASTHANILFFTNQGKVYKHRVEYPPGDPHNPMSDEVLQGKFRGMASKLMGESQMREIIETVNRLDQLDDIGELMGLMAFRQ